MPQSSVSSSPIQLTPIITAGDDRFLISFEIVAQTTAEPIASFKLLDRFGSTVAESGNEPAQSTARVAVIDFNRGKLPFHCIITDVNGVSYGPDELGNVLVPRRLKSPGIPVPISASTIDDYPECEKVQADHVAANVALRNCKLEQVYFADLAGAEFGHAIWQAVGLLALALVFVSFQKSGFANLTLGALALMILLFAVVCMRSVFKGGGARKQAAAMDSIVAEAQVAVLAARQAVLDECPPSRWQTSGGCGCAGSR